MEVLQRIMIRSSKAGVTESRLLPKCTKATVRLQFDPAHQESYNALVEVLPLRLPGPLHLPLPSKYCPFLCWVARSACDVPANLTRACIGHHAFITSHSC